MSARAETTRTQRTMAAEDDQELRDALDALPLDAMWPHLRECCSLASFRLTRKAWRASASALLLGHMHVDISSAPPGTLAAAGFTGINALFVTSAVRAEPSLATLLAMGLAELQHLRTLHISNLSMTWDDVQQLLTSGAPGARLHRLHLGRAPLPPKAGLTKLLQLTPSLTSLSLAHCTDATLPAAAGPKQRVALFPHSAASAAATSGQPKGASGSAGRGGTGASSSSTTRAPGGSAPPPPGPPPPPPTFPGARAAPKRRAAPPPPPPPRPPPPTMHFVALPRSATRRRQPPAPPAPLLLTSLAPPPPQLPLHSPPQGSAAEASSATGAASSSGAGMAAFAAGPSAPAAPAAATAAAAAAPPPPPAPHSGAAAPPSSPDSAAAPPTHAAAEATVTPPFAPPADGPSSSTNAPHQRGSSADSATAPLGEGASAGDALPPPPPPPPPAASSLRELVLTQHDVDLGVMQEISALTGLTRLCLRQAVPHSEEGQPHHMELVSALMGRSPTRRAPLVGRVRRRRGLLVWASSVRAVGCEARGWQRGGAGYGGAAAAQEYVTLLTTLTNLRSLEISAYHVRALGAWARLPSQSQLAELQGPIVFTCCLSCLAPVRAAARAALQSAHRLTQPHLAELLSSTTQLTHLVVECCRQAMVSSVPAKE